jgi:hypothetical protein
MKCEIVWDMIYQICVFSNFAHKWNLELGYRSNCSKTNSNVNSTPLPSNYNWNRWLTYGWPLDRRWLTPNYSLLRNSIPSPQLLHLCVSKMFPFNFKCVAKYVHNSISIYPMWFVQGCHLGTCIGGPINNFIFIIMFEPNMCNSRSLKSIRVFLWMGNQRRLTWITLENNI